MEGGASRPLAEHGRVVGRNGGCPVNNNFLFSLLGFVAVALSLLVVGSGVWFMVSTFRNFKDTPEEKWTCMDRFGYGHEVLWESKWPGTDVHVEAEAQIEFFALSCLENPKGGNCFENDGWFGAKIDVRGGPSPLSFSFDRNSPNITDSYRHHVDVHSDLARGLIAAFRTGTDAEIATLGKTGETLKVTNIKLQGFGPEMDKCLAIWAKGEKKP
jgi:hypothetical protein